MGALDSVNALNAAINSRQWDTVASYLTDDFVFSGITPQPVGAEGFLGALQAWVAAAPDWHFDVENASESGETVRFTNHITGTQTGTLALPFMPPFPPTGRHFEARDPVTATVRGNLIASITVVQESPSVAEQLGVPMPPM